jgi:hypothetical protein
MIKKSRLSDRLARLDVVLSINFRFEEAALQRLKDQQRFTGTAI